MIIVVKAPQIVSVAATEIVRHGLTYCGFAAVLESEGDPLLFTVLFSGAFTLNRNYHTSGGGWVSPNEDADIRREAAAFPPLARPLDFASAPRAMLIDDRDPFHCLWRVKV